MRPRPALDVVLRSDRDPILHLLKTGQVTKFEAGGWTEYSCPLQRLTLADLLEIAGRYVDDSVTGTPGSTAKDERVGRSIASTRSSTLA